MRFAHPYTKNKHFWLCIAVLFFITGLAYMKVFSAGFVSWDDADLLLNNSDVQQFKLKAFFTRHYVGNYMPCTMLLYSIDWSLFNSSSFGHHLVSVLFHFLNGVLVFILTLKLFKKLWGALFCALLFCIHPLQVESVAWVAETKTVLFGFFFLFGLIHYVNYDESGSKYTLYVKVSIWFILALLSKPAAVCFPLCLWGIDLILGRKLNQQTLLEKIPFLILSILTGLVALYTQQEEKYINPNHAFGWLERIGYAGYAILSYFAKFIFPVNLSVIYPYPSDKTISIITGFSVIILLILVFYFLSKKQKNILAGILFFILANLILVLQLVPFGEVLTADRYMYLALPGMSWLVLYFIRDQERFIKPITVFVCLLFTIFTFVRSKVWKNSVELYSDILSKYPNSVVALNSLGAEYMLMDEYRKAHLFIEKSIRLSPQFYKAYYNNGLIYAREHNYQEALKNFDLALKINNYPKALVARGNIFYELKDYARAISDANTVISLEPNNFKATFLLANCYDDINELTKAIDNYSKTITLKSNEPNFYLRRAIVFGKQQKFENCLEDLNISTELNPDFAEAYYWKGVARVNLKQNPCPDLQKAVSLGFEAARGPLNKYCK